VMYYSGEGVAKDRAEAARLYRLAADQGNAMAQYSLGLMYSSGEGVAKDEAEAARLFRLAADQGDAVGQYLLGKMYVEGKGVAKDLGEAARLFRLAADQGVALARDALGQNSFGRLHRKGVPMPKEAATPKVPASLYMLTSGQVPWVARTQAHART
jgi:TPR repeat protein